MDRYQLGKLVQWAGTLRTRKRMQKVIYLLQSNGCPFDVRYYLHHYGPYSSEVAGLTDMLVQQSLLAEQGNGNMAGRQFNYHLTPESEHSLTTYEQTPEGGESLETIAPFEPVAKHLLAQELAELEYASTIAYFRNQGHDWPQALIKGCEFKHLDPNSSIAQRSLALARQVVK